MNSLLANVLRKRGLFTEASSSHALHCAKAWIVRALPHCTSVLSVKGLRDSTLVLEAQNSIAAQECTILRESLLSALQEECPQAGIREISVIQAH
ncbi:DUF721 domain-containing protein [Candidatus Peregrinibacteria bacterium]|nr:DUF721 domain-containing protein [Candidatus Peregrinibacteria bacterium]